MKIVVCVKQVPDSTGRLRLDPTTYRLDRSGNGSLNTFDAYAVEEALRIKDSKGESEVIVLSLGPEKALDALRKGLAMGADRAVLVSDAAAEGSDLLATSRVLAKAIEREEADLALFGQQASDSDGGVLWAAIAERLRWPLISQVAKLDLDGGSARGTRQTEFGSETIEAALPAVIAVSDAIAEPRYPSLVGIMAAKKKPQDQLLCGELGLTADRVGEAGSKTRVLSVADPPVREEATKLEDNGDAAQAILDFLVGKKLL